jgi:hypothetical protein
MNEYICEKHKHCKPNCVDHNSFVISLRKYNKPPTIKSKLITYHSNLPHFQKQTFITFPPPQTQHPLKNAKTNNKATTIISPSPPPHHSQPP